jgi:hypothetical protein
MPNAIDSLSSVIIATRLKVTPARARKLVKAIARRVRQQAFEDPDQRQPLASRRCIACQQLVEICVHPPSFGRGRSSRSYSKDVSP